MQEVTSMQGWANKTKECIAKYLEKQKLPQDPKYENWQEKKKKREEERKKKEEQRGGKEGQAGGQAEAEAREGGEDKRRKVGGATRDGGRKRDREEGDTEEGLEKEEKGKEEGEEKRGEEVETCAKWAARRGRFRVTVDNQLLSEILCGHTMLKVGNLRPMCVEITNRIARRLEDGWRPARDHEDPVLWVPRELNKRADTICNIVMNTREKHEFRHARINDILRDRYNLKISSDGGIRGGRVSATGWAVWAVRVGEEGGECGQRRILEGGTFYDRGMSSLEAETRALVEALVTLSTLL